MFYEGENIPYGIVCERCGAWWGKYPDVEKFMEQSISLEKAKAEAAKSLAEVERIGPGFRKLWEAGKSERKFSLKNLRERFTKGKMGKYFKKIPLNLLLSIILGIILFLQIQYLGLIPVITEVVSYVWELFSLGGAVTQAFLITLLSIPIIIFILVARKHGFVETMSVFSSGIVTFLLISNIVLMLGTVFKLSLHFMGQPEKWDCVLLSAQGQTDFMNCLIEGPRPQAEKIGCRDCLHLEFINPSSSHVEGGPYWFNFEVENKDCPVEKNPRICGGKVLKDVTVSFGASYGNTYIEGDTYKLGDLYPGEKVSESAEIYGITKDLFKSGFFRINGTVKYDVKIGGEAEVIVYDTLENMRKGRKASKPKTSAGPVDLILNFAPSEIPLDRRNELYLTISFVLKTRGKAKVRDLKIKQYGKGVKIVDCTGVNFEEREEGDTVEYSLEVEGISLQKTSDIRDDVKSIRCLLSASETEEIFQSIKFYAESLISFYKPVEYYRSIIIYRVR